jgi:hypothetical protein
MIMKSRANVWHVLGGRDDGNSSYGCRSANDSWTNCERMYSFIHNFRRVVIMHSYSWWTCVTQLREHFALLHDRSHACLSFQDACSVPLCGSQIKTTANVSIAPHYSWTNTDGYLQSWGLVSPVVIDSSCRDKHPSCRWSLWESAVTVTVIALVNLSTNKFAYSSCCTFVGTSIFSLFHRFGPQKNVCIGPSLFLNTLYTKSVQNAQK